MQRLLRPMDQPLPQVSPTRTGRGRLASSCAILLTMCGCAETTASSGGKQAVSADPLERVSAQDLFRQGEQYAQQGDPIRAEQYVTSAVQRGFPLRRALPLLLRVCVASSRLGAALQYATPYLTLHPEDYHLRYLVAAVQLGLGRAEQAQEELSRVLREDPNHADAHYLLGVILRDRRGDGVAAAKEFEAHQRLNARGLHGAEVAAWLREHRHGAEPTPNPRDPAPIRTEAPSAAGSVSAPHPTLETSQPQKARDQAGEPGAASESGSHAPELGPNAVEGQP